MQVKKRKPDGTTSPAPTSDIIEFPKLKSRENRLTTLDRAQALTWAAGFAGLWCQLTIYADPSEHEDIGDFISIYKLGQSWASWGAARRRGEIVLWQADFGQDLGYFPTMREALEAITSLPPKKCPGGPRASHGLFSRKEPRKR